MWGSWTTKLGGGGLKGKGNVVSRPGIGSFVCIEGEALRGSREGDGSGVVITNVLGTQLKDTYEAGSYEVGRLGTMDPFASTNRVLPVV